MQKRGNAAELFQAQAVYPSESKPAALMSTSQAAFDCLKQNTSNFLVA